MAPHVDPASAREPHRLTGQTFTEGELADAFARALRHTDRRVVLILDDLHEVTSPEVHEGLCGLVARPPPTLTIVATTRRDPPWPLARLRLAGLLGDVVASRLMTIVLRGAPREVPLDVPALLRVGIADAQIVPVVTLNNLASSTSR